MSSKKKKENLNKKAEEFVVKFHRPKSNEIGSKDARLNEIISQSYLRNIFRGRKS